MDNDLMARRLRPPSEPPRPQNGYSPLPEQPMPWASDVDTRSDIPWDRPTAEAWPPLPDEPVQTQSGPSVPVADAEPELEQISVSAEPEAEPDPAPDTEPLPEATDIAVTGRAPWDGPEPYTWDETATTDDRSPDMIGVYDEMIPGTEMAVQPAERVAETAPAAATEHSAGDSYDAFAPVLGDVDEPVVPTWPSWGPIASVTAAPSEASPAAEPPSTSGPTARPTPPDDLFVPTPIPEQPATEARPADSSTLTTYATLPASSQPFVLRLELAIVEDTIRVRPLDGARPVGSWVELSSTPGGDDGEIDSFQARHPEFEPRSQAAAPAEADQEIPPATPAPPPWGAPVDAPATAAAETAEADDRPEPVDHWGLPTTEPGGAAQPAAAQLPAEYAPALTNPVREEPARPSAWDEPNPTAAWTLQPAPTDPLATLPAASTAQAPARSVSEQPDLWFLASEPEAFAADESAMAASSEPSRMMTAGLTVLMAVVVIGLVLAFLWLMTSLPILR